MKVARSKQVSAAAKCASFDIEVIASLNMKGLAPSEQDDVRRKLRNELAKVISKLPFAHVYPSEVKTK